MPKVTYHIDVDVDDVQQAREIQGYINSYGVLPGVWVYKALKAFVNNKEKLVAMGQACANSKMAIAAHLGTVTRFVNDIING